MQEVGGRSTQEVGEVWPHLVLSVPEHLFLGLLHLLHRLLHLSHRERERERSEDYSMMLINVTFVTAYLDGVDFDAEELVGESVVHSKHIPIIDLHAHHTPHI
jgi:hypothetical protein